jgi:hypothetical protein
MSQMSHQQPGSADRRHVATLVALMLVGVALVGLAAGFLLSRTRDDSGSGASAGRTASPAPTTATAPASPLPRPTVRAASEVERGKTSDVGYFLGARSLTDGVHVTFDRVQELTGAAAEKYAREHRMDSSVAARGVLVNVNPRTRDLVLAPDVRVFGGVQLAASSDLEPVPLQRLLDALATRGGRLPLGLTYDRLGYVVKVEEKRFG